MFADVADGVGERVSDAGGLVVGSRLPPAPILKVSLIFNSSAATSGATRVGPFSRDNGNARRSPPVR